MNGDIFIDGIENIVLSQGMVRMDLASFSIRKRDKSGKPVVESSQRIVMTPQGFLRTHGAMERMLNELVGAGVVRGKSEEENRSGPARDVAKSIAVKDRRNDGGDAKSGKKDRRHRTLTIRK